MRKKVCVVGINSSLVNNVIKHFTDSGYLVNFISFNELDLENPIYKKALNNIKPILYNDVDKINKAVHESELLVNMALLPTAENINNKLSTKVNFSEKLLNNINTKIKLLQFIPLVSERKMFYSQFDKIVKVIKNKQTHLAVRILYLSPIALKEESPIVDLDKIITIFHKKFMFNKSINFSLISEEFVLKSTLNILKDSNFTGIKEICLSSKQSIGLYNIQYEVLRNNPVKLCAIAVPFFAFKLLNMFAKIRIPALSSNYYKCLRYNRGLMSSDKNNNLVENISLKKLVAPYFLDKQNTRNEF